MDFRQEKGKQIALTRQIKPTDGGFAVQSQSSKRYYFVDFEGNCTCPDHQTRNVECKHSFAVFYYKEIIKKKGKNIHVERTRIVYKQDWKTYTQAQNKEIELFDKLLKDLVQNVEEKEYKFGRPSLSKRERLFCSIQKVYSQLSSRRAYSLYKNAEGKELIEKVPNYNAINKFLNNKEITPILKGLVAVSAAPLKALETKFAVDSTGFKTTRFYEYCRDKHKLDRQHRYVKLHALCGVKTNVLCSVEVTEENGADSPQFSILVNGAAENGFNLQEVSADKAYSSRANMQLVDELGGTPFIPFKEGSTGSSKGSPIWKKMNHYFALNQEEFNSHYNLRSTLESSFMALKSKFGDTLKGKNFVSQTNELLCKVIAYNIVAVIGEMHTLRIDVKFS